LQRREPPSRSSGGGCTPVISWMTSSRSRIDPGFFLALKPGDPGEFRPVSPYGRWRACCGRGRPLSRVAVGHTGGAPLQTLGAPCVTSSRGQPGGGGQALGALGSAMPTLPATTLISTPVRSGAWAMWCESLAPTRPAHPLWKPGLSPAPFKLGACCRLVAPARIRPLEDSSRTKQSSP
jgi:hypothetical protein